MIATVTLNPAVDYYLEVENLQEGSSVSAQKGYFRAGGKGLNVSQVLAHLGISSRALTLLGGFTGSFIAENSGFPLEIIPITGLNRLNTKIKSANGETEIHGTAPLIEELALMQLKQKLYSLGQGDILVLSGSLAGGCPDDLYYQLAGACPAAEIVLDSRGVSLREALKLPSLLLVKPNIHELEELTGRTLSHQDEILMVGRNLLKQYAIKNLIISMGKEGAFLITPEGTWQAKAPQGKLISSVGAGDSMVAGFIAAYSRRQPGFDAFKMAVACGSATAFSSGLTEEAMVKSLLPQIKVTAL